MPVTTRDVYRMYPFLAAGDALRLMAHPSMRRTTMSNSRIRTNGDIFESHFIWPMESRANGGSDSVGQLFHFIAVVALFGRLR
jgi:hypothetical protein